MKIASGIVSILIGMTSLAYVGIFGGWLGSAAGWLGSWGPQGNVVSNWADMVKILCWVSPLLAIIGGIITFSTPRFGGIIIAASAFSHWYLLGFSTIGNYFIFPLGAAAVLAFVSSPSTPTATPLVTATEASTQSNSGSNATEAGFDRAKWNALLKYDKDIALIAEKLEPLGEKWIDEFASSYLVLNDKTYLPEIEQKIVAAAKDEAEENEQQRIHEEEQQRALLQEQERLDEERKERLELWGNRFWGNSRRKLLTVTCGVVIVLLATVGLWSRHHQMQEFEKATALQRQQEKETGSKAVPLGHASTDPTKFTDPFAYCKVVVNKDGGEGGINDSRYVGTQPPNAVVNAMKKAFPNVLSGEPFTWRCMDGNVYGCYLGASGRDCRIAEADTSERQLSAIRQFCAENPNTGVPNAVNYTASDWRCDGTTPVINSTSPTDKRGYLKDSWHKISPGRAAVFHGNTTPQVKRQTNKMSRTLSMPANGDSAHITVPPQHRLLFTGKGFLMHTVYEDGHECVYGQGNCPSGPIRYVFVRDVSGKANSVTYKIKRMR